MGQSSSESHTWVVHKFGGTSVGNAERYAAVSEIIKSEGLKGPKHRPAIVVSAMKGVTDGLIELVNLARQKNGATAYLEALAKLKARHLEAIHALGIDALSTVIEEDFKKIQEVLQGIALVGSASEKIVEFVSGYGEIWSAQILAAYFIKKGTPANYLDAREVLVVDPGKGGAVTKMVTVKWEESAKKLSEWFKQDTKRAQGILVITGFVASTFDGTATTLKRNGSDFSATIFGKLLDASEITIWTDVDGVLSADPRLVPDALFLSEMTYDEVTELANFGAKVVHPATMEPAIKKNIPVWIRNTFNPTFHGTKIHAKAKSTATVKGFSAIENMAIINVEGKGLVGVSGVAERLFGSLSAAGISVVMISQASSEHSICLAVSQEQASQAKAAIEKAFFAEIHQGALDRIDVKPGRSILAAVGDNMVETPGVAGQFFTALGNAGVSIDAIAQGSSERNISAVIDGAKTKRALRAVHSAFFLPSQTIAIGLIGTGGIGKALLKQIKEQLETLRSQYGIDIRVRGIMNSKQMMLDGVDQKGIPSAQWLSAGGEKASLEKFIAHLEPGLLPHTVIIDATASDQLPPLYPAWLKNGFHIVTPNKKANTRTFAQYLELQRAAVSAKRNFFYSTTVGAGLPLISTLKKLTQTGDRLVRLEGVLSGTLSYIFNSWDGSKPFSEIVKKAQELGYTEPDPNEDLSGMDVARKLVILAREAGGKLELSDIPIESLVGKSDAEMSKRFQDAASRGEVLRYVGKIDENGKASVVLASFVKDHPLSNLKGADNIVSFKTTRYNQQPLVIQGPGAGPEITAAGVFSDLLGVTQ